MPALWRQQLETKQLLFYVNNNEHSIKEKKTRDPS